MEINSTIIVQAFNFLIAYVVLRILLFRPVMTVVEQEAVRMHGLVSMVDARKVVLTQKENEKRDRWLAHQQEFSTLAPAIFNEEMFVFKNLAPAYIPEPIAPQQVRNIAQQTTASLAHKVDHVR